MTESSHSPSRDLQTSARLGIDGAHLVSDPNHLLNRAFREGARCRWCGNEVHSDSYQAVVYNGGILATPRYGSTDPTPVPHIFCGCGDACMARDHAAGLKHLTALGVV